MYKRLLLTMFILICGIALSKAQTLKITDVDSEDEKLYSAANKRHLGKNLIIEVFDNSVRVKLANEKPLVMKREMYLENEYNATVLERPTEIMIAHLSIKKTLGVITSAIFKLTIAEKQGSRQASYIVTAKRF